MVVVCFCLLLILCSMGVILWIMNGSEMKIVVSMMLGIEKIIWNGRCS